MKIALVGIGKIALDQHVPALEASPDWELAATVSRHGMVDGIQSFTDIAAMLSARADIEVVSLCLPPVPRFDAAQAVLRAGRHLMLEKPPGATLAEVHALCDLAQRQGVTIFATWHSRMAMGVATARDWLADKTVQGGRITWREDVPKWHPGQDWIFEAGGMGVFDPGINANPCPPARRGSLSRNPDPPRYRPPGHGPDAGRHSRCRPAHGGASRPQAA